MIRENDFFDYTANNLSEHSTTGALGKVRFETNARIQTDYSSAGICRRLGMINKTP